MAKEKHKGRSSHANKVRTCRFCGRKILGNAYYRHLEACINIESRLEDVAIVPKTRIKRDVYDAFRLLCADRRNTIESGVRLLIEEYVKEQGGARVILGNRKDD